MRCLLAIPVMVAGCGVADDTCVDEACDWAGLLAARYTSDVVPTDDEVMEALRIYKTGLEALRPRLRRSPTPDSWNVDPLSFSLQTTDPRFTAPWDRQQLETGIPDVDNVLGRCSFHRIYPDPPFYTFYATSFIASQNIDLALQGVTSLIINYHPLEPVESAFSDVRFTPVADGVTDVRYSIGWGDCWTECAGQHFWLVRVPRSGDAVLVEDFGDPIPSEELAASQ